MKKSTLNSRLASYGALATTAALFAASSANAQVAYTDIADETPLANTPFLADIDNDGTNDFSIEFVTFTSATNNQAKIQPAVTGNSMLGSAGWASWNWYGIALAQNDAIGQSNTSWVCSGGSDSRSAIFFATSFGGAVYGNWNDNQDHYLGIQFAIGGSIHYGWVRVNVVTTATTVTGVTIKDWAYDVTADASIAAGDMGNGIIDNTIEDVNIWSYNNKININFNDVAFNDAKIEVYNTSGQLILSEIAIDSKTSLDVNASAGIYTVNVVANGQVKKQKVIIK